MTLTLDVDIPIGSKDKSVLLIANKDEITFDVSKVVTSIPNHVLSAQTGTLSGMNGTAVDLALSNDLVIFETTIGNNQDIAAVAHLRDELDQKAKLLVVTSDDISLSQARLLTRAGADDILTHPFDSDDLHEQIVRLTSPNPLLVLPQPASDTSEPGKLFAVAKSCGGIGGTTLAVNLADSLLQRTGMMRRKANKRVVLVDLDLQFGSVASFLDVEARDSFFHLAADGAKPDTTFLQQSMVQAENGISILTAPSRFAPLNSLTAEQIAAMVTLLRAEFDYVVIDLPQALVEWVGPILENATQLLMVSDSSVPSIRQARRLIDFYTEDNIGLPITIVMNREKKPLIMGSAHREAAKVLERPLDHWIPSDAKTARSAVDRGQPLSEVSGRSSMTKAISNLARVLSDDATASRAASVSAMSK